METHSSNHHNPSHVATSDKSPGLLYLAAAIAIIVFGLVGIAAFMGWIPKSTAHSESTETAVLDKKTPDKPVLDKQTSSAPKPSFERQSNASANANTTAKPVTPSRTAASGAAASLAAQTKCQGCGEVVAVNEVVTKAKGSGLGAAGGAVVGGVLGNQVGEGKGKDVATVAGVIGGAVAGNEIERRTRATKNYQVTVRLDDGTTQVINETSQPAWRAGDRVKVVNGVIQAQG